MKVKCINKCKINKDGTYQSLSVGKEYTVLAIEFYDQSVSKFSESIGDFVLYRIKGDDGVIIPFPAILFEITEPVFSYSWIPYRDIDGSYSILPARWARKGFWDDYYNDEEAALQDFNTEETLMLDN